MCNSISIVLFFVEALLHNKYSVGLFVKAVYSFADYHYRGGADFQILFTGNMLVTFMICPNNISRAGPLINFHN
jgi:hypothetical protein